MLKLSSKRSASVSDSHLRSLPTRAGQHPFGTMPWHPRQFIPCAKHSVNMRAANLLGAKKSGLPAAELCFYWIGNDAKGNNLERLSGPYHHPFGHGHYQCSRMNHVASRGNADAEMPCQARSAHAFPAMAGKTVVLSDMPLPSVKTARIKERPFGSCTYAESWRR